jgi:FKBP-type peptidyl-prolyl cis-trans isomerase FklB
MKMIQLLALVLALTVGLEAQAQKKKDKDKTKLKTQSDSVSYCLGIVIGESLKQGDVGTVNGNIFGNTISRVTNGDSVLMSRTDAENYFRNYMMARFEAKKIKQKEEGRKFLDENKAKPGVVTLASGLQYKVITEGTGATPKATDKVKVNYHGTLISGKVFDSSIQRGEPIELGVSQVIKGWTEALQLMKVGSKWTLYIPSDLAYGENPQPGGPIGPNEVLIFEVELLDILAADSAPEEGPSIDAIQEEPFNN